MSAAAAPSSSLLTAAAAVDDCGQASSSTIVGKIERGKFTVCVNSYSETRATRNGNYLTSSTFVVGGQSWRPLYYPNGNKASTSDHISIFLARVGGTADDAVCADVYFDLVIQPGEAAEPYGFGFRYTFGPDCTFGYPRFISSEKLESTPAYLKDDSFTLKWEITVERPPFVVDVPPSTLGWHLGDLLGEMEDADVAFDVGGETFAAHRYVLAARSLVFKAQLFGPMKTEKGAAIRVNDMHADVFRAFLHFIYADDLPSEGDDDDGEESCRAAAIMAQHLLVAADKYDLPRLKLICENKLSKRLDVSTAATTLALAEQHSCHGLKEVILKFLTLPSNMKAVKRTDGYKHLLKICPSLHQELSSRRNLA